MELLKKCQEILMKESLVDFETKFLEYFLKISMRDFLQPLSKILNEFIPNFFVRN